MQKAARRVRSSDLMFHAMARRQWLKSNRGSAELWKGWCGRFGSVPGQHL